MKKFLVLAILLTGILFPFGWLAQFSTMCANTLDWLFGTQASHVVGHSALFAGLALCLMGLLASKPRHWALAVFWIVLILVAFSQEAFQSISRGTLPVRDTLFDLAVDMVSGGIAVMVASLLIARRQGADGPADKATVRVDR
jgi:hypothetical protein